MSVWEQFTGRPSPPPPARQAAPGARGCPATPTERARPGGKVPATRGGQGREPQAAPGRGSRGVAARIPPPNPPTGPQAAGAPAPTPPRQRGWSPLPPAGPRRPRGGSEQGPPPRPSRLLPQEPRRTSEPAPTRQGPTRTAPRDGKRARSGAVWGQRPPSPERRQ